MNICFLHIRISVSAGHVIPNIVYKAPCLLLDGGSISSNLTIVEDKTDEDLSIVSPLKPHKSKRHAPSEIIFDKTEDIEFQEFLSRLRGRRNARELLIETYELNAETSSRLTEVNMEVEPISPDNVDEIDVDSKQTASEKRDESRVESTATETDDALEGIDHKKDTSSFEDTIDKQKKQKGSRKDTNVSSSSATADTSMAHQTRISAEDSELCGIMSSRPDRTSSLSRSNSSASRRTPFATGDGRGVISPHHLPTTVPFFCGNPAVEITNGIIHLYKSNAKFDVTEDSTPPETDTLCMLSVPASLDAHGIMEFTAPFLDVITRMRIIRDRTPNQYMVLLTFVSERDACNFYFNLNNQPFSSLLPEEICHLAFVASVEALPPYSKDSSSTGGGFCPLPNATELPDCMVCLERMDESVRGILTILCNHSFHAACLQQWEDLCCPVCRYVQTPEAHTSNKCMVCDGAEDLWICLVCGHVGCGRYTSEHAQRHYLETHHNYAMALSDNRVWDYAGDYFVHRLFQNKEDGKLVEKKSDLSNDGCEEAKMEAIQLECMHLLTSQLESQRRFWEEQVARAEKRSEKDRLELDSQLKVAIEKYEELDKKVRGLENEKQSLTHRNKQLSTKLAESNHDLANERELNKGLTQNQDAWKNKVTALEEMGSKQQEEIKDLKEQLRDVMFFIEASQKIQKEDQNVREEIRDGQVVVGSTDTSSGSGSRRKARGKRQK